MFTAGYVRGENAMNNFKYRNLESQNIKNEFLKMPDIVYEHLALFYFKEAEQFQFSDENLNDKELLVR